jgi:hypothetical protein
LVPLIVTAVPIGPEVVDRLVIVAAATIVRVTLLLATPPTWTTTGPLPGEPEMVPVMAVLLQVAGVKDTPSKVTVLVPWVEPKLFPLTVRVAPIATGFGDKEVIEGAAIAGVLPSNIKNSLAILKLILIRTPILSSLILWK